ncbi:MmcQ/YjbR family DNA-binding protein [Kitasatospora sp. DSM 101779]|uniref:MmcQ/YjbR family DNA-binding protein n=1 Tax=Kitasatospora sp. DSM 101779 TaxID=2853165 RepID=UPI0021D83AE3|nr:MmcQ/YjbR family DNA-binding protein [Kitasatospora sp. DSM 101779]MCU7824949.1 MmcQ/YjbR family DNA-binding protein [Kitasatospora sp. DSM 101779]
MVTFDQFLEMGLALPTATERLTWETEVTLRVGEKIFAMGAPESGRVRVKASKDEQAALLAADPETYAVAPYVGRHGWVLVELGRVGADELRELVTEAWRSTAPKGLVRTFDAERAT